MRRWEGWQDVERPLQEVGHNPPTLPMKHLTRLFLLGLLLVSLPDATAQSRTSDGWWDWAARSEHADRTSPRVERAERRGTVRPSTQRRRTTREGARRDRRDDRRRAERRRDRYDNRNDDRYGDRSVRAHKDGPPFCRNGVGHPTKGMQWCYEKGFAGRRYDRRIDRRQDRRTDRWERRTIEDIIFGTPRDRSRRTRTVKRSVLGDVLGRRALSDLERVATGPISGRWVYPDATSRVLQLRDRRGPLAELTDFDGDNRVDLVLVERTR